MSWRCDACTFINGNVGLKRCEMCGTVKNKRDAPFRTTTTTKSAVQTTIFGSIATKKDESEKEISKKKRRRDESTAVQHAKQETISFFTSTGNAAISETTLTKIKDDKEVALKFRGLACRKCAEIDIPMAELKRRAKAAMAHVFCVEKLRSLQPKAISSCLRRESCIVVMATGSGKSLCYQLPAVILGGTTIVISPLIALMIDQAQALAAKGVEAAVISSSNTSKQNDEIMERLLNRSLKVPKAKVSTPNQVFQHITILYVTPEQIQTERFRNALSELYAKKRISLFAIDEAHCISSWGHDFRRAYMKLDYLRQSYPDIPLIACTATATPRVLLDIKTLLRLEASPCHLGSFDRPNIFYKVKYKDYLDANSVDGALGNMAQFIKNQHNRCTKKNTKCSGIIYVHKRETTVDIVNFLRRQTGLIVEAYHAGINKAERMRVQQSWTSGKSQIAVATVAFGMGIDLPHVRYVIHWNMSKSLEAFSQESGRAGRDGEASFSLLYFDMKEPDNFRFLVTMQGSKSKDSKPSEKQLAAIDEMERYCLELGCRRQRLLKHFGEDIQREMCNMTCDYCKNPSKVKQAIKVASAAHSNNRFGGSIKYTKQPFTRDSKVQDVDEVNSKDDLDAYWNPNDLLITGDTDMYDEDILDEPDSGYATKSKPTTDFTKASTILAKYEAKECVEGTGFVNFRQRISADKTRDDRIRIPKHLIPLKQAPLPLMHSDTNSVVPKSSDFAAEAERLRAEIAKVKVESDLRRKNIASRRKALPPSQANSFLTKDK